MDAKSSRIGKVPIEDKPKKKGGFWKNLFTVPHVEDEETQHLQEQLKLATQALDINKQLTDNVNQLDKKLEEKNEVLMKTLETLQANNDSLQKQVKSLTETNDQLFKSLISSNKKAKIFRLFALLASLSTITITAWRFIEIFANR